VYSGTSSGESSKECIVFGAEIHFNFPTTHQWQQFSTLHAVLVQQIVSIIVVTIYKEWHCVTFTLSIVACKPLHTSFSRWLTISFSKYTFILKFTCSTKNPTPYIHNCTSHSDTEQMDLWESTFIQMNSV